MGFYATDGKNIKSLAIDDMFGAGFEASLVGASDAAQPRAYYTVVPFVRRAVRLRANAVAGVPITLEKNGQDISSNKAFAALMSALPDLIWRTEFALSLSPYGAYWKKDQNRYGLNPTPEWLLPQACYPYQTAEGGTVAIRYTRPFGVPGAGKTDLLSLDDVVRFWYPSLDRANWPGSPPGLAALAAASALSNKDTFTANYFRSGALKSVILTVPTATQADERNRLKSWWQDRIAGVRNAWRTNVISADVKPIVVGEGLGDIGAEGEALVAQYRQDVAAAFEVPESMLLSNAANYATAKEERISFYEETVFPELALILAAINTQWLLPSYGAALVAHPEQTEARQDAQVEQAGAITQLVGEPVLTVDEGRAWLGMDPMEAEPAPDTEAQDYTQMEAEAQSDAAAAQDAESGPVKGVALPGTAARLSERASLSAAHARARQDTRDRHHAERVQTRQRYTDARQSAKSGRERLTVTMRQRSELATLLNRQGYERMMLRAMHTAERGRMAERHASQRELERTGAVALEVA